MYILKWGYVNNNIHIILYSILNSIHDQLCDRAYLPEPDLAKRLRERSIALFGVETRFERAIQRRTS